MKTQKQTINEMIAQIIAEARKLGYSEATIWRNITPKFQTVPFMVTHTFKNVNEIYCLAPFIYDRTRTIPENNFTSHNIPDAVIFHFITY